ncbi:MAG: XamI family restriction endonuclease [Anaerolineae bacterium]|nr:XamI family restriction endonuclease [Anaerolineae bacterium]
MLVNANKPELWKADVARSIDFYNRWFIEFAPRTWRQTRQGAVEQVISALTQVDHLRRLDIHCLKRSPEILPILRMVTAPPIARDRLIGLSQTPPSLIKNIEIDGRLPSKLSSLEIDLELQKIIDVIQRLIDIDLFPWFETGLVPEQTQVLRAATVVADRLCGAIADPVIRNAQEQRQLATIQRWLQDKGYTLIESGSGIRFDQMPAASFAFHINVPVRQPNRNRQVNLPVDAAIMPSNAALGTLPLLIEAKSAGDFTNTNKRRKEEATKMAQLRHTYGERIAFVLFLCGYFDSGYLGYEAAEGIDWVWEHRIDDLAEWGI